ncbi:type I methionyl aminopeptidase [Schaalia suimastitidis]|uniref:type I methionyl aminopeptidase n=1 Tax=Schaalia suimastitidis TaxID=121163 RepID=UPI000406F8DF|nr:M24 family metallopeptidase [Schaalia suimastitidis]
MGRIEYKTRDEIRHMRRAGLIVAQIHAALREAAVAGVSTGELDDVCRAVIARNGGHSNFLNYHGYPATVCISVNDIVVHGIPGKQKLCDGDIVSFDCGAWVSASGKQWHGDAAFTCVVGDPWVDDVTFAAMRGAGKQGSVADPHAVERGAVVTRRRELDAVTREALWAALAAVASSKRLSCVGQAVEDVVADRALELGWEAGIIEEFTGHGIGTAMHQEPEVLNYRARGMSPRLKPGMVLAVEPMLTTGGIDTRTEADDWTVRCSDGSDAAQWEHTIAILDDGISILTAVDGGVAGLAPYGVTPVDLD